MSDFMPFDFIELDRSRDIADQLDRNAIFLCFRIEPGVLQIRERADRGGDRAEMRDGLDDVARPGLALAADHCRALVDTAKRLAEVACAADEGHLELMLLHVELNVGRREDLAFVDVVDAERFQDLRLDEVSDAALRHDRNGHSAHDLDDLLRIAHACDATRGADVRRDALQGHDRHGARIFGDPRLLGGDDIHDHAALEHPREAAFQRPRTGRTVRSGSVLRRGHVYAIVTPCP